MEVLRRAQNMKKLSRTVQPPRFEAVAVYGKTCGLYRPMNQPLNPPLDVRPIRCMRI